MNQGHRYLTLGLAAAVMATLTACGGGAGGGVTPSANSVIIKGVAATGLAIANGSVTLACVTGTTSPASTATDGSYSVDVGSQTLPCVARVDFTDSSNKSSRLHSLVKAAGTVNINPVTDMIVASLSATGVAADVKPADVNTFTQDRIDTATQLVKTQLASKGISTAFLPADVIGTTMTATAGSTKGDSYDSVLDDVSRKTSISEVENELSSGHESGSLSTSTGQLGDATAGKAIYEASCLGCHGARISDASNASKTLKAIQENEGGMGRLAGTITSAAADSIATYMASLRSSGSSSTSSGGNSSTPTALTTQTISFTSPGNQTLGATAATLSATASSGLVVTITSSTSTVCSVNAGVLKLLAAGSCILTASQSGNASYAAAPSKTVAFTVVDPNAVVVTPVDIIPVAANGKTLYGPRCSGCHGPAAAGGSNVLKGANSALTILSAINRNTGGMGGLSTLTTQNLADIAAYLATPNM